ALRTVYLMTGDAVSSEDIVQEVFVTCYSNIGKLRHPEYFKTWFFKILTRTTWQYMKKERRLVPSEDILEQADQEGKKVWMVQAREREGSQKLYLEILQLEPKLQTTIILYYYSAFSVKEIAKVMGCLEGTVKSRLYTGRKKLQTSLIEQKSCFIPKGVIGYGKK
ncbi:MAG: RNA polymerase sigma factor, partial [Clostridium sp.]